MFHIWLSKNGQLSKIGQPLPASLRSVKPCRRAAAGRPLPLHLIGQPFHCVGQLLALVLELLQRGGCCLIGGGAALL